MSKKPEILTRKQVARTRIFGVEEIHLRFANGEERVFERLMASRHGAVMIIPMQDEDTVLLIREYAAGVDRYELALPKGLIEPDESPLQAANREMMEEVGCGANRLTALKSLSLAPGYLSHTMHVVLAEDLYEKRLPGDEPEPIEVVPWRLSELDALLAREDCTEARTVAALYMVREHLRQRAK